MLKSSFELPRVGTEHSSEHGQLDGSVDDRSPFDNPASVGQGLGETDAHL